MIFNMLYRIGIFIAPIDPEISVTYVFCYIVYL